MNYEEQLKTLADAQKRQKQAELNVAQEQKLNNINTQQNQLMPTFQQQRNQASTQSQIKAKNFGEYLANTGRTYSGLSRQFERSNANTLGNTIAGINTQEGQAVQGFANQRVQAGNDYLNNLNNVNNQINTDLTKNLYNEKIRQGEQALEQKKYEDQLKQQTFSNNLDLQQLAISRYNAYKKSQSDNSGKVLKFANIPINYQTGLKGVANGNKVTYNVPNQDGSLSQVTFDKGVNPFTGTINPDAKKIDPVTKKEVWNVWGGYQPDNVKGSKLSKSGATTTVNGQTQNVWKTTKKGNKGNWLGQGKTADKNEYYVWDGATNQYWVLTAEEKQALGLK